MISELNLDDSGVSLLESIIAQLVARAPARSKCVFLNCEMRNTPSDFAISADLFAVIKPVFGKVRRVQLDLSWETARLLNSLGQNILSEESEHTTIDVIIDGRSKFIAYQDNGALHRLKGGDACIDPSINIT